MNNQPHLDSRDVRFFHPADPGSPPTIADLRAIRREAFLAGYASGLDAGADIAQTEISALVYERGIADERARVAILCDHLQTDLNERTRTLDALTKAVLRHRDAVNDDRPEAYAIAREMWAIAATPATTTTTGD